MPDSFEIADVAWFAGLFEGEGSILTKGHKNNIRICITSTDRDVLDRARTIAGGSITTIPTRQSHWKQAWLWSLDGAKAAEFLKCIRPFLMSRRGAKADEMLNRFEQGVAERAVQNTRVHSKRREILALAEDGLTDGQIATCVGMSRSYVNAVRVGRFATEAA